MLFLRISTLGWIHYLYDLFLSDMSPLCIAGYVSLTKMQYMAFLKKADIFCQTVPTLQHRVLNSANSFGTRAPFFFLSVWFCGLQKLALFELKKIVLGSNFVIFSRIQEHRIWIL